MKKLINKKTIFLILHLFVSVAFAGFMKIQRRQINANEKELIRQFSKKLNEKEIKTRKRIFSVEQKTEIIKRNNKAIRKQINTADNNYKKIIRNLKKSDHEKIKTDIEINNASDSSDWNWFNRRFPKSKNNKQLSVKTNTTFRKPSQNGQFKSNGIIPSP